MSKELEKLIKVAMSKALDEWLDKKFAQIGKWAFYFLVSAALGALSYFILQMSGWTRI